jgi:hypothetical protein
VIVMPSPRARRAALPALMAADYAADLDPELDLLIHGLRTSARDGQAAQCGDRTSP